jgi:4-coumarate--CoA ligase
MPTPSSYPTFELPSVDLFDFIFSTGDDDRNEDDYAEKRMIYYQADGSRQYTFAEVRDGARCFGESLRQQWGWHCGDVLAVIAPNDVDYSIAVFGVLYAGGVVLPLNPMYSDHELAHMLQDAGAKALVVHESLLLVAQRAAALSNISKDKQLLLGPVTKHMTHPMHICDFLRQRPAVLTGKALISPHKDLAFVVYSSGTTSLPKGVMLSHRNIVADLLMIRHSVGSNYNKQQDSILGVLPFYHIYGR